MSNKPRNLNLRIYRRNRQAIILLWDKLDETDSFDAVASELSVSCDDTASSERFQLEPQNLMIGVKPSDIPKALLQEFQPSEDTVICVIGHEKNKLDPDATYYFRVSCYDAQAGIRVMPAGVYPPSEKEDKRKNFHLFGWDKTRNEWHKVEGVRDRLGRFCLLVATVDSGDLAD